MNFPLLPLIASVRGRRVLASLLVPAAILPAQPAPVPPPGAPDPAVLLDAFTVKVDRDVGFVAASPSPAAARHRPRRHARRLLGADARIPRRPQSQRSQRGHQLDRQRHHHARRRRRPALRRHRQQHDPRRRLQCVNRNFFTGGSNPSTYNLERMDYARGPNSILFGTGTISGTSNAVREKRPPRPNATEVRAEIGSWESYRATVDANYSPAKSLAARVVTTWQDTQTFRDWERTQRRGVSPSLTVEPTRTTRISLIGDYYEQKVTAGMNALNDALPAGTGAPFTPACSPPRSPADRLRRLARRHEFMGRLPASGRGFDTALSYTGLMQTTFLAATAPSTASPPPAAPTSASTAGRSSIQP
jgi:hypothetical protein